MKSAFEAFLIGFEVFVFCGAVAFLLLLSGRFVDYEKAVNKEINEKIDITTTYDESHESYQNAYIDGASVIAEIMEYDGSITVRVNSTVLNNIRTDTGEEFFTYIKKYGNDLVMNEVSITSKYKKEYATDSEGNLSGVIYTLV